MLPSPLPAVFPGALASLLGPRAITDPVALEAYAWDNTGLRFCPQAVALAESAAEVARIMALCHRHRVPVIPRGAGSGNVGGALAVRGGLVLSTQRMQRIVAIRPEDRYAVVEPGVVNNDLQEALKPHGLFWPPNPSSARTCTVGGNLAMCAAGPNAPRYGVTRDWVLGLSAVLADGTAIRTGGKTTKGVVGYDLTRLLIGSEGTLAVVTEAILKLAPIPPARRLLRAVFASVPDSVQAISALMAEGTPPTAIEFLGPATLDLLRQSGGVALPAAGRALLLVETAGDDEEVDRLAAGILRDLERFHPLEVVRSRTETEAAQVWEARFALAPALKKLAPKRVNEDVVVPVSRLAELIAGLEALSTTSGLPIANFGHGGNGNIHVNILVDPSLPEMARRLEDLLDKIFALVLRLEGTLSGEHGVGIQKMPYIHNEVDPATMALQRSIKALFDPLGLLNPGKIFPPGSV
ncbi:MAG: FAD-binding protein [Magnetococcales bacterium]|nr:FAD-binding protein [Magnetococcales bacterium]